MTWWFHGTEGGEISRWGEANRKVLMRGWGGHLSPLFIAYSLSLLDLDGFRSMLMPEVGRGLMGMGRSRADFAT
eukprot:6782280-Prymnesium_polylepis.1